MVELAMSTLADYRAYPLALGRLMADPLFAERADPARLAAFVRGELERLDPASARIAEVEARYWRGVYRSHENDKEQPA
jgi:hypothetical protein